MVFSALGIHSTRLDDDESRREALVIHGDCDSAYHVCPKPPGPFTNTFSRPQGPRAPSELHASLNSPRHPELESLAMAVKPQL